MGLTLDNQTLLYIIIGLLIIQSIALVYYVQSTVESRIQSNNKKITKSFTGCIDTTFDKYVGKSQQPQSQLQPQSHSRSRLQPLSPGQVGSKFQKVNGQTEKELNDSIDDPADNELQQKQEFEEQIEDQEECVTDDN